MATPTGGFSPLTNEQIADRNVIAANEALTEAGIAGDIIAEKKAVLYTIELKQAGTSTLSKSAFEALLETINLE